MGRQLHSAFTKWTLSDLESFGEPHNEEFMNFIKDKSAAAATRVSWFRWAKHLSHYFLMALVWRNKFAACLQTGIYWTVAILMKRKHMTAVPLKWIFSAHQFHLEAVNAVQLPASSPDTHWCWMSMQQCKRTQLSGMYVHINYINFVELNQLITNRAFNASTQGYAYAPA